MNQDIIIIGAGPAGLMAACELAKAGQKVLLLEARDRIGGRIHTIHYDTETRIEAGAEFIHGHLPITLSLLKKAGFSYTAIGGRWINIRSNTSGEAQDDQYWPLLMRKLEDLQQDMPLQDFLALYFSEPKYAALNDRALAYAEGYDSADASRVSAIALYKEWSMEEEDQYRINGGYAQLMNFLAAECTAAGCRVLLDHPASIVSTLR